jgi:hypothetical protein
MPHPNKYPYKSRGGLLPIGDTVNRRLQLNIEFKYWVTQFGINVPMFQNCFKFRNKMIHHQRDEERMRSLMMSFKEPVERIKIKKYVGEFY